MDQLGCLFKDILAAVGEDDGCHRNDDGNQRPDPGQVNQIGPEGSRQGDHQHDQDQHCGDDRGVDRRMGPVVDPGEPFGDQAVKRPGEQVAGDDQHLREQDPQRCGNKPQRN